MAAKKPEEAWQEGFENILYFALCKKDVKTDFSQTCLTIPFQEWDMSQEFFHLSLYLSSWMTTIMAMVLVVLDEKYDGNGTPSSASASK